MTAHYQHETLQGTFNNMLATEVDVATLRAVMRVTVLSEPIQLTGALPYGRLGHGALRQIEAAAIATEGPSKESRWGRMEVVEFSQGGLVQMTHALYVVEQLYADHATTPQYESTVSASLDAVTRHMVGFARLGRSIEASSLAQAQGIDPHDPNAPKPRRAMLGTNMTSVTPLTYAVRNIEGQVHVRPRFRNTLGGEGRHCPAADNLVTQETGQQVPALYTFLRTMGSMAASIIYPRSFVIVPDPSAEAPPVSAP